MIVEEDYFLREEGHILEERRLGPGKVADREAPQGDVKAPLRLADRVPGLQLGLGTGSRALTPGSQARRGSSVQDSGKHSACPPDGSWQTSKILSHELS